jgi:hypothetical protein
MKAMPVPPFGAVLHYVLRRDAYRFWRQVWFSRFKRRQDHECLEKGVTGALKIAQNLRFLIDLFRVSFPFFVKLIRCFLSFALKVSN